MLTSGSCSRFGSPAGAVRWLAMNARGLGLELHEADRVGVGHRIRDPICSRPGSPPAIRAGSKRSRSGRGLQRRDIVERIQQPARTSAGMMAAMIAQATASPPGGDDADRPGATPAHAGAGVANSVSTSRPRRPAGIGSPSLYEGAICRGRPCGPRATAGRTLAEVLAARHDTRCAGCPRARSRPRPRRIRSASPASNSSGTSTTRQRPATLGPCASRIQRSRARLDPRKHDTLEERDPVGLGEGTGLQVRRDRQTRPGAHTDGPNRSLDKGDDIGLR